MEDKLYEPAVVNIHSHLFLGPFYRAEGMPPCLPGISNLNKRVTTAARIIPVLNVNSFTRTSKGSREK